MARVLGLDPGLRRTGWGVIETAGNRLRHVGHGVVATDSGASVPERLCSLYEGLVEIVARYEPDEASVEETFVNRNPESTLKLGLARGVVLLAPALAGLPVHEYAANRIKKALVGAGHADKEQVALMVRHLLPGVGDATADATDALAAAICHAHAAGTQRPLATGSAEPAACEGGPMIAKLRGVLDSLGDGWAVVDVGGVGYLTYCSAGTLASLPQRGQEVSLTIETVVREDHIHLYGFASEQERDWFRLLQTVQSVGARLALAILGALPASELAACIAAQDRAGLTRAPGVGPKLAARILSELRTRRSRSLPGAAPRRHAAGGPANADAIAALVNLGYRPTEAHGAVSGAARTLASMPRSRR